jgi:hypothetical protein
MRDQERFAGLLGHAAVSVWGDMPRDIQEALFETAMKGHDADREAFARGCCMRGICACYIRRSPGTEEFLTSFVFMNEPLPVLMEIAIQIAWDYLERSGEMRYPAEANRVVLKSVESQVFKGERRRLMLANKAIDDYKKFKAKQSRLVA